SSAKSHCRQNRRASRPAPTPRNPTPSHRPTGSSLPDAIRTYVRVVDDLNYRIGRFAMYLLYPLGAILLASTASRIFLGVPINWALEMSQFILSAYYLLGGAYTFQL